MEATGILPYPTPGRTVLEADLLNFAGFSGDFGPYHMDHPRSQRGVLGGPALHGLGTLAIASGLVVQSGFLKRNGSDPVALLRVDSQFRHPTHSGDTILVQILEVDQRPSASRPGHFVCTLTMQCVSQRDEVLIDITWISLQRGPLIEESIPNP